MLPVDTVGVTVEWVERGVKSVRALVSSTPWLLELMKFGLSATKLRRCHLLLAEGICSFSCVRGAALR